MLRVLLVALIAGGASFFVARQLGPTSQAGDEVGWLVREFNLNSSQAAEVKRLHEAFQPICEAHCKAVRNARDALNAATDATARQAAQARMEELQEVCHQATREHLQQVAAVMPANEAERYLNLIQPLLSEHQHAEPFGLQ